MDNKELISQCLTLHKENKSKSFILEFIRKNSDSHESSTYVSACYLYNAQQHKESLLMMIMMLNTYNKIDTNLFCYNICHLLIKDEYKALEQFANLPQSIHNTLSKDNIRYLKKAVNDYILRSIYRSEKINIETIDKIKYLLSDKTMSLLKHGSIKISNSSNFILSEIEKVNISKKNIIQCYYNESCSGIGDFLRGCCFLFDHIASSTGAKLFIDFENHDIGHYIKAMPFTQKDPQYYNLIKDVEKINKNITPSIEYLSNIKKNLLECVQDKSENLYISSNYSDIVHMNSSDFVNYRLSEKCKQFMKNNMNFNKDVKKKFRNIIKKNKISSYEVMHFRCGDLELVSRDVIDEKNINTKDYNISYEDCWNKIIKTQKNTNKKIVVLADSNKLKEYVTLRIKKERNNYVHVIHLKSQHCSDNPGKIKKINNERNIKIKNMFYVALDLKLLTGAEKIHSYSVYPWGSGFCFWISKIYDIPFLSHRIGE